MIEGPLLLAFGDATGDHIGFTLHELDGYSFIRGGIHLVAGDRTVELHGRSGIEPLALSHLRTDLVLLLSEGGTVFFGDHDFGQLVELTARSGEFAVAANLPSQDLWDITLPPMRRPSVEALVAVIDEAERRFGRLTAHCGCGQPSSSWFR